MTTKLQPPAPPGIQPPGADTPVSTWRVLLRWRWWLAGAIGLAFAAGQALEAVVLPAPAAKAQILLDVVLWGGLGVLAVWASLTWAGRQERRHQAELEESLRRQQTLNRQLQRSNSHLALLSEANHRLAASISLDELMDAALTLPQRLVPAEAAALWLHDPTGAVLARTSGDPGRLETLRARFAPPANPAAHLVTAPSDPDGLTGAYLHLPLFDAAVEVGRIELYLARRVTLPDDEWALLQTMAGEIGEAITSAQRRVREERAVYALERAIGEERARIAQDIHDGLAQTLAFRRMRIDLWLDWLDQDPARLREELLHFKHLLREEIVELRQAIFALRPIAFDDLGFVGGMHRYIADFGSQQGWTVQVDLSGISPLLSPPLEAISFRIVQEALTNAAKHAQATEVSIRGVSRDGGVQFVISDNGRGFDPNRIEAGQSGREQLGLRQMRERLAALNGRLTILAQPGAGTELRVWLPVDGMRDPARGSS